MSYRILVDSRAAKELERLPKPIVGKIDQVIAALADQPRPPGSKLLRGKLKTGWRVRVGDYRVLYRIDDERQEIAIFHIAIVETSIDRDSPINCKLVLSGANASAMMLTSRPRGDIVAAGS